MFHFPQAIKNDQLNEFKAAVQEMKRSAVTGTHCLDVCEMVIDVAADAPRPIQYPMTLLAFAGYHARYNMLKFLISEGAGRSDVTTQCNVDIVHVHMTLM